MICHNKIISDVIHRSISVSNIAVAIIDTNIFKRLSFIKQTGALTFKYPSATHTRFEHSIGVYHLTGLFLNNLIENTIKTKNGCHEINQAISQIPFMDNYVKEKYGIKNNIEHYDGDLFCEELIEMIKIAGLIHDLGHGPFSHLFDNWLSSKESLKGNLLLEHEHRSIELFKLIVETTTFTTIDGKEQPLSTFFTQESIDFISNLISPSPEYQNNFIFQIVSNQINGFDVDKLDYIVRDSHYIKNLIPFYYDDLIKYQHVINGKISFPYKCHRQILEVYQQRYALHKDFYNDTKIICVELMIKSMLNDIDNLFRITENLKNNSLANFIHLVDSSIINIVDNIRNINSSLIETDEFRRLNETTIRINKRQFYTLMMDDSSKTPFTDDAIEKHLSKIYKQNPTIPKNEIFVVKRIIGFLSGNKPNPLKLINFYDDNKLTLRHVYITDFSNLLSGYHQESLLYLIHAK